MEEQISKVWILEQFNNLHASIDKKLETYVTNPICDERRNAYVEEKTRINTRMDNIDDDMDTIKESFDSSLNKIRMWVWGILGAIIGELIMIIIGITMNADKATGLVK